MDNSCTMNHTDHDGYLSMSLQGALKKSASLKFFDRLLDTLRSSEQTRVLIDASEATVETSIFNALTCAEKVSRITPRKRVALLIHSGQRDFGENNQLVFGNRGLSVGYFLNEEKALEWLTDGDPS